VTPIEQILDVGLGRYDVDTHLLAGAISAINDCVQACTTCADLCILDDEVADLRACIRVCLDTADIGRAVSAVVSRRGAADRAVLMEVLELCLTTAVRCEEECARHEQQDQCRMCAVVCRRCISACRALAHEASA
jgi:hypothetical protein